MSLRLLLFDNIWLKLFSFVLALLIWLAVRGTLSKGGENRVHKFRQVPVMLLTEATEHRALQVDPGMVDVTVRGSAGDLESMTERDVLAFVRVTKEKDNGTFPVDFRLPPGVQVFLLSPASVTVRPVAAK
jgi:YbbR domain-containing protein